MQPRGYFLIFCRFDTGISSKDPDLVYSRLFEMNWRQTYRGLSFYVGWMRGMLVCDNPLSSQKNWRERDAVEIEMFFLF